MTTVSATKSAELQLKDELQIIRQGYEFLDEKRILLAGEILSELEELKAFEAAFDLHRANAAAALRRAIERHGLGDLQLAPASPLSPSAPQFIERSFLGIALPQVQMDLQATPPAFPPVDPSVEMETCREAFRRLLYQAVKLACIAGNLTRIAAEFRQTEQRARALENVLLPEVRDSLKAVSEQLELAEQEEIARVHLAGRQREG
jgi:V/A-type H+-transporting ATPase subunit D